MLSYAGFPDRATTRALLAPHSQQKCNVLAVRVAGTAAAQVAHNEEVVADRGEGPTQLAPYRASPTPSPASSACFSCRRRSLAVSRYEDGRVMCERCCHTAVWEPATAAQLWTKIYTHFRPHLAGLLPPTARRLVRSASVALVTIADMRRMSSELHADCSGASTADDVPHGVTLVAGDAVDGVAALVGLPLAHLHRYRPTHLPVQRGVPPRFVA